MPQFQPVQFGKYFLLDRIATGGMAEVFKAKIVGEHGFEKIVIIKTLFPHLQTEKELVDSFIEEAKLAALLQHQNIVQIYDFGKVDESYFIAMEYLSGINLRKILDVSEKFPLNMGDALFITQQICAGLNYAYNIKDLNGKHLHLIHRDVSPPNIIITDDGQVKIIDFGIAKASSKNTSTRMGIIKGKVAYMSPEQAEGKLIDHRSDIFSIGIILYEMVSRHQMYKGDTVDVLSKARNVQFEPIEIVKPDLPEPIKTVINKALKKNIALRYQSSVEMMNDIEKCIIDLTLRPSGHELTLFVEQIARAEKTRKPETHDKNANINQVNKVKKTSGKDNSKENDEFQETIFIDTSDKQPSKKRKFAFYSIIMAIIFVFVIFPFPMNKSTILTLQKKITEKFKKRQNRVATPLPVIKYSPKMEAAAIKALEQKRFHDAVMQFENLLTQNPAMENRFKQPYTKALLGAASESIEQESKIAKELLLKAIAIDKGSVDAFFNLGYVYAVDKDYKNAEIMYKKAVDLKPPYLDEALFNLSVVQDKLGKKEMAANNLKRAFNINPNNTMVEKYLEKFNKRDGESN